LRTEIEKTPEIKEFQPEVLIHLEKSFRCVCPITGEPIDVVHRGFVVTTTGKLAVRYSAPNSTGYFEDRIENIHGIEDGKGNTTTFAIRMEKNNEYWAYARVCQENGERYIQAIQYEEIGGYVNIRGKKILEEIAIALNVWGG
jgi:hypothetical protein